MAQLIIANERFELNELETMVSTMEFVKLDKLEVNGIGITLGMWKELLDVLQKQNTTDKGPSGGVEFSGDEATYNYIIDEDYNVTVQTIDGVNL